MTRPIPERTDLTREKRSPPKECSLCGSSDSVPRSSCPPSPQCPQPLCQLAEYGTWWRRSGPDSVRVRARPSSGAVPRHEGDTHRTADAEERDQQPPWRRASGSTPPSQNAALRRTRGSRGVRAYGARCRVTCRAPSPEAQSPGRPACAAGAEPSPDRTERAVQPGRTVSPHPSWHPVKRGRASTASGGARTASAAAPGRPNPP